MKAAPKVSPTSVRRLVDTIRSERTRADRAWAAMEEAEARGEMLKAGTLRVEAANHERVINLILGAVPELERLVTVVESS